MTTGEKIKALRKKSGMTQAELAEKLGCKDSVIAKYENGRITNLKRTTISNLARVFNVSPMYFMDDAVDYIAETGDEYFIVEMKKIWKQSSKEQQDRILKYAQLVKEGKL